MKELRFRIIIIFAAIAVSIYFLYPTYQDYQNNKGIAQIIGIKKDSIKSVIPEITIQQLERELLSIEDSIKSSDPSYREARQKRVKLGLDLQGGMRVVLEVNTAKLLEKLANNADDQFREVLEASAKEAALSDESVVDIFGRRLQEKEIRISRYFGSIREDDSQIIDDLRKQSEDAVTRAMEIIRNRVDQYGVAEPTIQKQGDRRVIVELPGIAKEEEARQLLQGTALLEFKLLKDPDFTINIMQKIDEVLAGKSLDDSLSTDTTQITADVQTEKKDTLTVAADTGESEKQL
ncbi:MAG TPA: protein translocase subunit SecD, partial [Ignavibacteriaceae bacterium]|nr:protein translocase subunit SecD [Ignavibacteriaceae bacterium]